MPAIPGFVYLIIGAAIAIVSKIVQDQSESSAMGLFMLIGVVFFLIGLIKILNNKADQLISE